MVNSENNYKECVLKHIGNVGRMDAIVRCGRCLAGGRGCLLKGPHLIPSLKFRWMLPKKCDTICGYISCSQILFCPFYLLLQPLLELGSKSTSLSSGFSDVIKAVRYDLLIHCLIS